MLFDEKLLIEGHTDIQHIEGISHDDGRCLIL
jgi:hypothetical protein